MVREVREDVKVFGHAAIFLGHPEGEAILDIIEKWAREEGIENLRVIGSNIAAQAYPGRVLVMSSNIVVL